MTDPDRLSTIKARLAAATQEPWACEPSADGKEVYGLLVGAGAISFDEDVRTADIDLISNAPDDLRWAIDEIDRLRWAAGDARTVCMHGRDFGIDGRLVTDVAMEDCWPFADTEVGGRMLLFHDDTRWTVLAIHRLTTWRGKKAEHGFGHVTAITYPDLTALRAAHQDAAYWRSLLETGAEHDVDLHELWRDTDA